MTKDLREAAEMSADVRKDLKLRAIDGIKGKTQMISGYFSSRFGSSAIRSTDRA